MTAGVSFRFKNRRMITTARAWAKELEVFEQEIHSAMPLAVREGLFLIFETSQMLVPVDTSKLKDSGYIDVEVSPKGHSVTGTVGYGENGVPHYTLLVHEDLSMPHTSPTQAKFLEEAYNREVDNVEPTMKRFLKNFLSL